MMRVKVYPGPFETADILDENGYAVVDEGTTAGQLLKTLECPRVISLLGLYTVNHRRVRAGEKLHDGDVLSMLAMPSGG
jgi:hypothetical protein